MTFSSALLRSTSIFLLFALISTLLTVDAAPLSKHSAAGDAHSQCMTITSREDRIAFHRSLDEVREIWARGDSEPQPGKDQVAFNVSFTVVYANKTVEGGYVPADRIKSQIERLNLDYSGTGFSFVLVNTTLVENPDWFVNVYPGSETEKEMKKAHNVGDAATLNIYSMNFNNTIRSLGTASMPSFYFRQPELDGVMVRHTTLPGGSMKNFNLGRTLTHEVGHWLGLFHTFEGGCLDGVGDNIADTPPQASGSEGCPKGRDSCPGDGPDLINNFMDYSYDSCMDSFTRLQIQRMHEAARAFRQPGGKTIFTANDRKVFGGRKKAFQW